MSFENAAKIHQKISSYTSKTPLVRFRELEHHLNYSAPIYLKCENFQNTHSFKVRGAAYTLLNLNPEERNRGVVSRSSGNFAQALAYIAQKMNVRCKLVLPKNIPAIKLKLTQQYLPEIFMGGATHKECDELVQQLVDQYHYIKLSPFDHPDMILGAGSLMYEILNEKKNILNCLIPLGGGGLSAGCSQVAKDFNPKIRTIAVEPVGANDYFLSRKQKKKVRLEKIDSIADGLRAPSVGEYNYPILEKNIDEVVTVNDDQIIEAMRFLFKHLKYKIEPSGAITVAALMFHKDLNFQGEIVLILSGGNIEDKKFFDLIDNN